MPKRYSHDLSHLSFQVGRVGQLQTLSVVPVVAGDSFSVDLEGVFRLSPLRRNLTMDCMVDLMAFYVPYRHIELTLTGGLSGAAYTNYWNDFILGGADEEVTLSSFPLTGDYDIFGVPTISGTVPAWLPYGYTQIFNRYFRDPTDDSSVVLNLNNSLTDVEKRYGIYCCFPKTIWSTGVHLDLDEEDHQVDLFTSGLDDSGNFSDNIGKTKLDIIDLARVKARYHTELEREWFGQRYSDLVESQFGSKINADADERPTLVMRKTEWLTGYDVDGSDDATLGEYSGKAASICGLSFPRRYFPEHGTLWLMALLRFPPVSEHETHYLVKKSNPTYKELAGDPEIIRNEPPMQHTVGDFFNVTDTASIGYMPYAQWYRYHPSTVHADFDELKGFPFVIAAPTNHKQAQYYGSSFSQANYDAMFKDIQLQHWHCQTKIEINAMRVIPPARQSIFAGT